MLLKALSLTGEVMKNEAFWKTQSKRVNFDQAETDARKLEVRADAEKETNQDLQKPIQQLICDVHEESSQIREDKRPSADELAQNMNNLLENMMHANKRTVSFMGSIALDSKRASDRIDRLTRALVILTVVLVILTGVLVILTGVLLSK
jgi:hypothetical protein